MVQLLEDRDLVLQERIICFRDLGQIYDFNGKLIIFILTLPCSINFAAETRADAIVEIVAIAPNPFLLMLWGRVLNSVHPPGLRG